MGKHGVKSSKTILLCSLLFIGVEIAFGGLESGENDGMAKAVTAEHSHSDFSKVTRIRGRVLKETFDQEEDTGQRLRASRHITAGKRTKRHVPVASTKHVDGGHLERLKLELPLDSINHILDLQLNRDLITEQYFEKTQKGDGHIIQKPSYEETELCHYHGKIRNRPQSWAAISTCDGQISGVVFDGSEMHYLEPYKGLLDTSVNVSSSHDDIFRNSVNEETSWEMLHYKHADFKGNLTCGHDKHKDVLPGFGLASSFQNDINNKKQNETHSRQKRGAADHTDTRVPYNSNSKSRYVEIVMVVDSKKYKDLGGDLKKTVRRTKDIANIVNALYQPFNIFIALVGIVVWTEVDEIKISTNGDETLTAFLHYRKERLIRDHPNDNAQLLTAVEFENGVVGKAMQGPICSYKYSGGVNSDFRNNLIGIVATTVAHELGHNFGLAHDQPDCQCSSSGNRCIMAASASSNHTSQWSSCSIKDMAYAFDHGMDYCLRNKPKSLYDAPTCGNGFTEPGEECDCGLPEHCENPCCDASTCLIHLNATCASGTCCDMNTCHVKAGGTPCRETTGLCDLPEYCTGESEFCPEDVHKLDGLTCQTPTGQAYCYNGECRTHTDQCKLLWGPSGNNSNDLCYQRNANGSRLAHCGYDLVRDKYSQCKTEDSSCGVLHCQMNTEKLEFGYESAAILASFFVNAGGKIYPCRSVTVDFGLQDINPGMTPDGASCGEDKMCVSQKCVPVKSVLGSLAAGCADCSGNGVCNSRGHCHCHDGYGGHLCEGPGYGGSIDSGPAYYRGTSQFAKYMYVTCFGFIPLILVISFYIYFAKDYVKSCCLQLRRGGIRAVINNSTHLQPRGGPGGPNKPTANGTAGGNRTGGSNHTGPDGSAQNGAVGEDFFGNYKGFSLSPIKSSPNLQRNGNAGGGGSNGPTGSGSGSPPVRGTVLNNNNINNNSAALPNGHIQSSTNENVYYSPVARVENETLVKNSSDKPTLKNPSGSSASSSTGFLGGSHRGSTRVSWAQPIASRLPVSPPSEDESVNSDTPLYENSSGASTPTSGPRIQGQGTVAAGGSSPLGHSSRARPMSSPDALNEMKGIYEASTPTHKPLKKESSFIGSNSALSRIAAAFPFVRNSLRASTSQEDNHQNRLSKNFPKNVKREGLEISKPILQNEIDQQKIQHCIPITPTEEENNVTKGPRYANLPESSGSQGGDQVDSSQVTLSGPFRYANVPSPNPGKPALKNFQRVKDTTPPPEPTSKPIPKVQRAHSMIQPSTNGSNRNSIHERGNNPNYNSLRRSRPSAPPPKPPDVPPPPPPNIPAPRTNFFKSSTPPPYNSTTTNNPSSSPSSVRASILKFSFGRNPGGAASNWLSSKVNSMTGGSGNKAPVVPVPKPDDLGSPTFPDLPPSPPPIQNKEDNIYDTIDEGIPPGFEKKAELASSEESSPKKSPETSTLEEKIETLSTGSSENGGLLADIISEIKCRNKESIYNSVDRKKQKAKKKAAAAAAAAAAEKAAQQSVSSVNRTPKLGTSSFQSQRSSPAPYISPKPPVTSTGSSLTGTGATPPARSYSISPKPLTFTMSAPKSSPPLSTVNKPKPLTAEKPKVVLNPTSISRPSTSALSSSIKSKNDQVTPPRVVSPATSSANLSSTTKPTCAVNGIPKASTTLSSSSPASSSITATPSPVAPVPSPASNVTSSPSYVAKINYFSNLSSAGANNTPMKPISSLPAPTMTNPAKEIIYAPSSVSMMGNDGTGEQRSHLSTIRRSQRPSYFSNKDSYVSNEDDRNENNKDNNHIYNNSESTNNSTGVYSSNFAKKPGGGIYASLGRKVPTPVIRSNSIEKEKIENSLKAEKIEKQCEPVKVPTEQIDASPQQVGGYKPFNPYLNRPLTFSTFRPNNNAPGANNSSSSNNNANSSTKNKTLNNSSKPVTLNTYSISNNKTATTAAAPVGLGVTSPVQIRTNRT